MITKKSYYPWVVVGLLWFVALLNYMDRQILATLRPSISLDIKELSSAKVFGNLMAIFLWIYGFMSPISGILADKINRKNLIIGSLLVWSLVTLLMGFASSYNELFVLRAVMGVSEAIYIPAALSLIADYHRDKTRSLAIAIHLTGLYIGQALGGFGGTFAEEYSWTMTFKTLGIVGIIYGVILCFFLYEVRDSKVNTSESSNLSTSFLNVFKSLFTNMGFWIMLFYFAIPSLPGWATKNWLPTLVSESLQIPMSQAGPIATITIALSSLIGVLFGGLLSDKWFQKNKRGRIYISGIGLFITIPALILLGFGHSIVAIIAAGVLFGLGFGIFDSNNMPILCQIVSPQYRASAYGFLNMVGVFFGALITNYLGNFVESGQLGEKFVILAGVVLCILVIQQIFLKVKY